MSELLCIHMGSRAAHACGCGSSPRHIYSKLYLCNTVYCAHGNANRVHAHRLCVGWSLRKSVLVTKTIYSILKFKFKLMYRFLSSLALGILIMKKEGLMVVVVYVPPKSGKFSRGVALPNAPSTAHGARSAAATKLRPARTG